MSLPVSGQPLQVFDPAPGGTLIQVASVNQSADITTTVLSPTYATLFSASFTTTLPSSDIGIRFYAAYFAQGGGAANIAGNFRFLRNGTPIPPSRGCTGNQVSSRIETVAFDRRIVGVAAGLQTITVEWTRFGGGLGASLAILAASLPDLFGAHMTIENWRP